jgi:2-oxo-4-hydroxy-4-carboxy--5-ureidoimidazoline (OHCU) decarboxylase
MSAALKTLNALPPGEAEVRFLSCCGSSEWARRMAASRPFRSVESLAAAADRTWQELSKDDWLEAFAAHPAIGSENVAGTGPTDLHPQQSKNVAGTGPPGLAPAADQVAGTGPPEPAPAADHVAGTGFNLHPPPNSDRSRAWSRQEQSGTRGTDPETLEKLSRLNREYARRFGRVFLVCATGRSADEMLALGRKRLENDQETELAIAAEEQRKITRLRLEKLLSPTER